MRVSLNRIHLNLLDCYLLVQTSMCEHLYYVISLPYHPDSSPEASQRRPARDLP
jgi:hypothetical protein